MPIVGGTVGAASMLLMVDMHVFRARVLPALREWVVRGVVADWWQQALLANRIARLDRVEYPLADHLDAAATSIGIFDPLVGLNPALEADLDWSIRRAVEIAVTSATTGDGIAFGNAVWIRDDLLDLDEPLLNPPPQPEDRITAIIEHLDQGLIHMQSGGGGFSEGYCGMLDAADTACLDDDLTARGSTAVAGTATEIRTAFDAVRSTPPFQRAPATLLAVHGMAHRARRHGFGLLHGRDLDVDHLGEWKSGILFHHAPPE
jgi:hypothetical protein